MRRIGALSKLKFEQNRFLYRLSSNVSVLLKLAIVVFSFPNMLWEITQKSCGFSCMLGSSSMYVSPMCREGLLESKKLLSPWLFELIGLPCRTVSNSGDLLNSKWLADASWGGDVVPRWRYTESFHPDVHSAQVMRHPFTNITSWTLGWLKITRSSPKATTLARDWSWMMSVGWAAEEDGFASLRRSSKISWLPGGQSPPPPGRGTWTLCLLNWKAQITKITIYYY